MEMDVGHEKGNGGYLDYEPLRFEQRTPHKLQFYS